MRPEVGGRDSSRIRSPLGSSRGASPLFQVAKVPRRGIEPRPAASKAAVLPAHSQGMSQFPKGRRLDSHQLDAAYKTAAFLIEPRRQSTGARSRTLSSGFGDRLLSREHTGRRSPSTTLGERKFENRPKSRIEPHGLHPVMQGAHRTGPARHFRTDTTHPIPRSSTLHPRSGSNCRSARRGSRRAAATSAEWESS